MLPDAALRDADLLAALLATNDIERMLITPTLLDTALSSVAARASLSLLRSITLCGELPTSSLVERARTILPDTVELINLYSSCEAHDVALGDLRAEPNPFALCPLPHVETFIVDQSGEPVAEGIFGSLLVGGAAATTSVNF